MHERCSVYDLFCEPILFLARVSTVRPLCVNCPHLGNCLGGGGSQHLENILLVFDTPSGDVYYLLGGECFHDLLSPCVLCACF